MKKGDSIRINIQGLTPDGSGFTEIEGRTVVVNGTLPGDEVDIRIMRLKRYSAVGSLESIVTAGVRRIDVKCPHFFQCGGCRWQDVPYDVQCSLKTQLVREALAAVGCNEMAEDIKIIPSPGVFYYRNKMEFSFDKPPGCKTAQLGLHEYGRYDRVFDITDCYLQSELSNKVVSISRRYALEQGLSVYGLKSHTGLLRFLMVRDGKTTGGLMVNLVTSGEEFEQKEKFCHRLMSELPSITTVIRSINRGSGSTSVSEEREILFGYGTLRERVGNFYFTISPDSFFQPNTFQTKNLYDTIAEFCGLSGTEHLLDLYCGTGTIGIYLADRARKVTGIEVVEDAIRDAQSNAEINEVDNITFTAGRVEKLIHETMGTFDVVVCDPPRSGIHPKVMHHLVRMRIPRMVYVSCNVRVLPRDLEILMMAGYRIEQVRVFDMAPHTPHVETVILLKIG